MQKLLSIILIILFALPVYAQEPIQLALAPMMTGAGASGGAAATTTYYETFDGSSACVSGGDSNCLKSWTSWVAGSEDWSYTTAPLNGTNSYGSTGGLYRSPAITATDTMYVTQKMVIPAETSASDINSPRILNAAGGCLCSVAFEWRSGEDRWRSGTEGSACTARSAGPVYYHSGASPLWVKLMYTKGTGANAICRMWSSTDGTTWSLGSDESTTDDAHNDTAQAEKIAIGGYNHGSLVIIDQVIVSTTDITDAR